MLRRLIDCRTPAAKILRKADFAAGLRFAGYGWCNAGRAGLSAILLMMLVGCHGANHFFAEDSMFGPRLPDGMRVASKGNTQTVDLSGFASASGSSENIGIGDLLEVTIAAGLSEADQSTMSARVQDGGRIELPEIGFVEVGGVEPQVAESLIRTEAIRKELYRNPTVTVNVKHRRMNRVRVLGAVKNPGVHELSPNASDVVSAIAAAQGLAEDAGQHVEVRNPMTPSRIDRPAVVGDPSQPYTNVSVTDPSAGSTAGQAAVTMSSYTIDLIDAAKAGDGQYMVQDGGVIMVEKSDPPPIYVQGLVNAPNRYDYPIGQDLRLLDAIALAHGMSNQLANKIYVVRQVAGAKDPAVIEISYREAKRSADSNLLLSPGDVVTVEQTPATVVMEALNIVRFGISGTTGVF